MKPDSAVPADLLTRLRQQLILAQVRIMELEDSRDEIGPRLAAMEKLLGVAQILAEQKAEEAAHLAKVGAELQSQYDHLRHIQHVTNEALEKTRAEAAELHTRAKALLSEKDGLHALNRQLSATGQAQLEKHILQDTELRSLRAETAARLSHIESLDAEQRAMKSSRSWRWTAWLRTLERTRK